MKKGVCLVLALALCLAVPGRVSAASWFSGLPGGSPGLGSACSGAACDPPMCPAALKFDVGYLFSGSGVHMGHQYPSTFAGVANDNWSWRVQGVQLGATFVAPVGNLGLLARGTWLIPDNQTGQEKWNILGAGGFATTIDWPTKTQYWTVEGAAIYPACEPFGVLVGFRYASVTTDFTSASFNPVLANYNPADQARVQINEDIPYIGLAAGTGMKRRVRVWALLAPWTWGNLQRQVTFGATVPNFDTYKPAHSRGYFGEVGADVGMNVMGGSFDVLAKWTGLHNDFQPNESDATAAAGVVEISQPRSDLNWNYWTLAAQFSLPFSMPFGGTSCCTR